MTPLTRRRFLTGCAAAGCLHTLSACNVNPATGRSSFTGFMSPQEERKVGAEENPKLLQSFGGEYRDPALARYVAEVGRRVAAVSEMPSLPYRFIVLNSPIVNAMALPGGYVYITRGLIALAADEAELAGVLAHEVGHIAARHTAERYSQGMLANIGLMALEVAGTAAGIGGLGGLVQVGAETYLQGFSRDQELEADTLGVRYLGRAGYDPRAMVDFLTTLRRHDIVNAHMDGRPADSVDESNMMATHPRTVDRVRKAIEAANATVVSAPHTGRKEYLAHVDGLLFGDDAAQGIIRGDTFIHPELRFEFKVPRRYRLANSVDRVTARHPEGAMILFDIAKSHVASMSQYLGREWMPGATLNNLEPLGVNGMEGATGSLRGNTRSGAVDIRLVAMRRNAHDVFRFIFVTPTRLTGAFATDLKRTTYSLRAIDAGEAAQARPLKLLVVPVQAEDTAARLAATLPFGPFNEEWFRLLNGLEANEAPKPGAKVKVVVG